MSGSSHLESSDESTGDEKETKITIHKQEITDTETDKYINDMMSKIESRRKFRYVRGFDQKREDEWKEAFIRASLVEKPVTEIESGGTVHTNRSTLETYILVDDGRSCISICREDGCRRHADRMSKLGLGCPLVSGSFYSVAAKRSMILFSLKVAVALYILDKKLEILEPHECWARFKTELQDEKERLCYKEDGRNPHFHHLSCDNGALLKTSYTPFGRNDKSVTLCRADWCIRSAQKRSNFCSLGCSIASVKQQETTSMTSNVPEVESRGGDSPGVTICGEKGVNDKLPTTVSLPVLASASRAKFIRSKKIVDKKPPSASQLRESGAYKRIPGTTRQIFTQQSSSSDTD